MNKICIYGWRRSPSPTGCQSFLSQSFQAGRDLTPPPAGPSPAPVTSSHDCKRCCRGSREGETKNHLLDNCDLVYLVPSALHNIVHTPPSWFLPFSPRGLSCCLLLGLQTPPDPSALNPTLPASDLLFPGRYSSWLFLLGHSESRHCHRYRQYRLAANTYYSKFELCYSA